MNNHTEYYNKGKRYAVGISGNKGRIFAVIEIDVKKHTSRPMNEWGNYKTANEAQKVLDDYAEIVKWALY